MRKERVTGFEIAIFSVVIPRPSKVRR